MSKTESFLLTAGVLAFALALMIPAFAAALAGLI